MKWRYLSITQGSITTEVAGFFVIKTHWTIATKLRLVVPTRNQVEDRFTPDNDWFSSASITIKGP